MARKKSMNNKFLTKEEFLKTLDKNLYIKRVMPQAEFKETLMKKICELEEKDLKTLKAQEGEARLNEKDSSQNKANLKKEKSLLSLPQVVFWLFPNTSRIFIKGGDILLVLRLALLFPFVFIGTSVFSYIFISYFPASFFSQIIGKILISSILPFNFQASFVIMSLAFSLFLEFSLFKFYKSHEKFNKGYINGFFKNGRGNSPLHLSIID